MTRVPVLAHRRVPHTKQIRYVAIDDALTRRWSSRACTTAYAFPTHPHRLVLADLATYATLGGVTMQLLIVDIDDHEAHASRATTTTTAWRDEQRERFAALLADRPGGYVYSTPRGYRAIWRIAAPFVIRDERDVERWRASYLAALADLAMAYGIVADPSGSRWGQTFDLPCIARDGLVHDPEIIGDASAIGAWDLSIVEPTSSREHAPAIGEAADSEIGRACTTHGLSGRVRRGRLVVRCPFFADHSPHDPFDGSTVVMPPTSERRRGWLHCSHASCAHRRQAAFTGALGVADEAPAVMRLRHDLAEDDTARLVSLDGVSTAIGEVIARVAAPDRVVVVRCPTGAGKSRAGILAAHSSARRVVLSVPTHALADEHEARLAALGTRADRRRGVLRVVRNDGAVACRQSERASALQASGGSVPSLLCPTCEHRSGCPARRRERSRRVVVAPHQLAEAAIMRPDDDAIGDAPLLIVDETPALLAEITLTRSDLDDAQRMLDGEILAPDFSRAIGPWVRALAIASDDPAHDLSHACAEVDASLHRRARTMLEWSESSNASAEAIRTGVVALGPVPRFADDDLLSLDRESYAEAMRAFRVFRAVLAAQDVERIAWRRSGLAVHVDTAEAILMRKHGAIVLDATPPLEMLRASMGACEVWTVSLRVPDGAPIERVILASSGASRSALAPGRRVDWAAVRSVVARALDKVPPGSRTLLVTHMPIADGIRRGHLADLLAGRIDVPSDVAHYGAIRGIDRWRDHDACVTIGDPWPDLGSAREQATALKLESETHAREVARAELAQAHGRLRAPSRNRPATLVHVGNVAPLGWTTDTTTIEARTAGRPRTAPAVTVDVLRAWVAKRGQRAAATELGIARRTLRRYLDGRALPASLARRVSPTGFSAPTSNADEDAQVGAENPIGILIGISAPTWDAEDDLATYTERAAMAFDPTGDYFLVGPDGAIVDWAAHELALDCVRKMRARSIAA